MPQRFLAGATFATRRNQLGRTTVRFVLVFSPPTPDPAAAQLSFLSYPFTHTLFINIPKCLET